MILCPAAARAAEGSSEFDEAKRDYEYGTRLFEEGRYQEAAEVFQHAASLLQRTGAEADRDDHYAPRLSQWHTEQAEEALRHDQPLQALTYAERALKLDPQNQTAERLLPRARHAYEAQKAKFEQRRAAVNDALRAEQQGHDERAVELWRHARLLDPDDPRVTQALQAAQARVAMKKPKVVRATELDPSPQAPKPLLAEYLLATGDVVEVFVYQQPDLTRDVIVRPDGRISFPLVGDLQAAGLSLTDLDDVLTEQLKTYLRFPDVSLAVKRFGGTKTIVMGEVGRVGIFVPPGEGRILDAIVMAGGFSQYAVKSDVMVIRGGLQAPQIIKVNIERMLKQGALEENIVLQPDDIIFVPKTKFASTIDFLGKFQPILSEILVSQSIATAFGTRETSGGISR